MVKKVRKGLKEKGVASSDINDVLPKGISNATATMSI